MKQIARVLAWLSTRHALPIALGVSFLMHLAATIGTPVWISVLQVPRDQPFIAILKPMPLVEPSRKAESVRTAPQPARRRAMRPSPRPIPEATFVAPENAIALDRVTSEDTAILAMAEDGRNGKGADTRPAVSEPDTNTALAAPGTPPTASGETPQISTPALQTTTPEIAFTPVLPRNVSIAYKATTSVADGIARYKWAREGENYTFESTIQASGFFVEMFVGAITQKSVGKVTAAGLEPTLFTIRRGDREAETAEFLRDTKEVKFSRGPDIRQIPMPPNLQDTQSFLFQLAVGAASLKNAEDRLTILATNARGINSYTFRQVGALTLETRFGPVETVHLVRETNEPRDGYEVWLSPKHYYLPVKLKFFVDRFPAELIATNITSTP